jgi:hypothetical protein
MVVKSQREECRSSSATLAIAFFTALLYDVQVLDGWSDNISKILSLVETACQKIQKESMQHNVPIGTGA